MRLIILVVLTFCISYYSYAQTKTLYQKVVDGKTVWVEESEPRTVINKEGKPVTYLYVEQMPQSPYDVEAYLAEHFVRPDENNLLDYPARINVRFMVMKDGSIDSVKVLTKASPAWTKEAARVVKSMPPWKPGYQNGRPVNLWYTLPIIPKFTPDTNDQ